MREQLGKDVREHSAIGIKPVSEFGKRLVRQAIQYAIDRGRGSVTLVHKGNIMKFTEGAFKKNWGYERGCQEFGDVTITEDELWATRWPRPNGGKVADHRHDRIADNMLQQLLTRTDE